ncbi:MAG: TIGR04255 family protein [Calditrichota bacterium]
MNLPDVPRVIYNKTSLREVICQFRFPTILRIRVNDPVDFQEEIRTKFPLFKLRQDPVAIGIPEQIRQVIAPQIPKMYDFSDENETSQVSLTEDFLALSTKHYERFENFMDSVDLALNALSKVYQPSFYVRVGFRYIDIINREILEIQSVEWADLLNGCFAGELGAKLSGEITETTTNTIYNFDWGALRCKHGLRNFDNEGSCYYIDNDFFKEGKIQFQEIQGLLKRFNEYERNFLRYCISDKLHSAMEPMEP